MDALILKSLEICGFRGFVKAEKIEFGTPLTFFYGLNRNGKSSITNAVEWCLFGPDVAAIKYGDIRERDGWEVKNINAPKCYVRCVFEAPNGESIQVKRTYKTPRTSNFEYGTTGGRSGSDHATLHALLNVSADDFVSSVHLHPEVVRTLLTDKPKDRQEAIDRLLGLSEMRELAEAYASAKTSGWTAELERDIALLDDRLKAALGERQRIIDQESKTLLARGIARESFTENGAVEFGSQVITRILAFCDKQKLTAPSLSPVVELADIHKLTTVLPTAIANLRKEHPVLADQGKQLTRKNVLEGIRDSYADQRAKVAEAEQNLKAYGEARTPLQVDAAIAEIAAELEKVDLEAAQVSQNSKILLDALTYFKTRSEAEFLRCPLCGEKNQTASDWRSHIQQELDQQHLAPLTKRREELTKTSAALQKAKGDILLLQKRVNDETTRANRIAKSIEDSVGRKLGTGDDPVAVVNQVISVVDKTLASLQDQVQQINAEIEAMQLDCTVIERFYRVGTAQKELRQIEAIEQNASYIELRKVRSECEQYAEDVDILIEGLKSAVKAEAETRLTSVQANISDIFNMLTNRPDYPGLRVVPSTDGYVIELFNPKAPSIRALPILNHADLNCAALSIFLALASSPQIAHKLRFVIVDDPSQSLDRECKINLCSVLARLCENRQIIIATADDELKGYVLAMTKNKMAYTVRGWSPTAGPVVEQLAPEVVPAITVPNGEHAV